jgi:hypothetical protein
MFGEQKHGIFHKMLPELRQDIFKIKNLENRWEWHFEG